MDFQKRKSDFLEHREKRSEFRLGSAWSGRSVRAGVGGQGSDGRTGVGRAGGGARRGQGRAGVGRGCTGGPGAP